MFDDLCMDPSNDNTAVEENGENYVVEEETVANYIATHFSAETNKRHAYLLDSENDENKDFQPTDN